MQWGVLGAGAVATHMVGPALHAAAGAELYAVAARDVERAAALAPTGGVYPSYDELLRDPGVDAVYIALHNAVHAPWAMAALRAGKHVLCEKPLALSAADVDVMAVAAAHADRLLIEALFYRWHPQIRRSEQIVRDGRVGTVRHVEAGFSFSGVAADTFRMQPEHGGGALYDLGCYPISAALCAFGRMPDTVSATLQRGSTGVDVSADLVLHFDEGEAVLHVSMDEPGREYLSITGDRGVLHVVDRPFTAWFGADSELRLDADVMVVPASDPYRLMVEQVSAAMRGEPAYVVPLHESRAVAAVVDAAFESAGKREPVAIG